MLYPLLFKPVYKDYIWGGTRIGEKFSRTGTPCPCAESWEISAHPDGMSVVENGELAGRTLLSLCEEFGSELLGTHCAGSKFPLLFKIIDAKQKLSLQVHPSDESAGRCGGEAKTEMWYILDAPEGARICAGLKRGVGPRIFRDAIKSKTLEEQISYVDVVRDKAVFIPGGLVHAICDGCLIFEVQQNSNTTYRVFDWNRVGPDGRGRQLHIEEALNVIDWHMPDIGMIDAVPMTPSNQCNRRDRVLRCDYFSMERYMLTDREDFAGDGTSFCAMFVPASPVKLTTAAGDFTIPAGRSCLIPACMGDFSASPAEGGFVSMLTVRV